MRHFKNFKVGTPKVRPEDAPQGAIFIIDDAGNSWYDVMGSFQKDTWKVVYWPDGLVSTLTQDDPNANVFPIGCSVLEVASVPEGATRETIKVVDGKVVTYVRD